MRFSERLYALTDQETQQALGASIWVRTAEVSSGQVQQALITNDLQGRVIILNALCLRAAPAAAQLVSNMIFELMPPSGQPTTPLYIKAFWQGLTADVVGNLDWTGEVIIPPLWSVRGQANYNAGGANNTEFAAFGYAIPIGTLTPA